MSDPQLLAPNSATGVTVAISVSDSADLTRLGLTQRHCRLAVAELARAVFVAGGSIIYGGDLRADGFTWVLADEARRYSARSRTLTVCLAAGVHGGPAAAEIRSARNKLGRTATVVCLDQHGRPVAEGTGSGEGGNAAAELSAMRRYITAHGTARVIVGGRLDRYSGRMPGVLEETLLSLRSRQPIYAAGGFGGAGLAVCRALETEPVGWAPADLPSGLDGATVHLEEIREAAKWFAHRRTSDGLTPLERQQLAVTHRPGDIASLVVRGLSRIH